MKPFKVMIVDDEVLAIEHLKKTICWEDYGFNVIAETSIAKRALSLVSAHMPDIIFMDIRMPYIDGLELSKQILSLHKSTKIILLTSYKDFDYAKEALKIGVSDYIVKHELGANQLVKVLDRMKQILISQQLEEMDMLRQRLKTLLESANVNRNETAVLQEKFQNYTSFFLVLLKVDQPFPVIDAGSRFNAENIPITWEGQINAEELTHFSLLVDTTLQKGHLVCLFSAKYSHSIKQLWELQRETSLHMQQQLKHRFEPSVSIYISQLFHKMDQLQSTYEQLEKFMRVHRFSGKGRILHITDTSEASYRDMTELYSYLHELERKIERFDYQGVHDLLDRIFRRLAAIHANAEPLEETCKFLSSLLDKHRQLAHLPAYEELMHEGQLDRLSWFTLEGIWNWYKNQFDLLMEVWNQNKNLSVHKKIQRAKTYIQRNYQQDLTIECVGKEVGTSGDYIRHLFKEITGQTLIEYITEVRIEKAKQYIQTGKYKIYEISSLVGYKSGQYFAKVFKQFTGLTPQSFMEGNVKSREIKN